MLSIRSVSHSQFDAYALKHPKGNFHQTSHMAELRTLMGWEVHTLLVYSDKNPVGALLLAGKKQRFEVTMGPLCDFSDKKSVQLLLSLIAEYARKQGAAILEMYPYELYQTRDLSGKVLETYKSDRIVRWFQEAGWQHKGYTTEYDPTSNRWLFTKNLADMQTEADLLASYRQTTRQTVRKLQVADYSVKAIDYDNLAIVKKLIDSSNEKNSIHITRPLEYYQRLHAAFGGDIEFLVVYHKEKTPLSTGIFIRHPSEMVYFMSGTDSQYRQLYGGHYLQHWMMLRCIKEGVERYNFYGISGNFSHNPLLVYKAGFRGVVEEYIGGFSKTLRPTQAALLKAKRLSGRLLSKVGI